MPEKDATEEFLQKLPELGPGESFKFRCHKDIACFNACCGDLHLMLTPYDALRLRQGLKLSSKEFVNLYTTLYNAPDTGFPMLKLNMQNDERKSCPYVTPNGCSVYSFRPGACRTYPLGRASKIAADGGIEEKFFIVREPHCQGFEQDTDWTSDTWLADQGLLDYNRQNDHYLRLMALARGKGARLSPKQANMAYLALFNTTEFMDFVGKMGILDRLEMDEARRAAIFISEDEALAFGFDWLELAFFGQCETLKRKL